MFQYKIITINLPYANSAKTAKKKVLELKPTILTLL